MHKILNLEGTSCVSDVNRELLGTRETVRHLLVALGFFLLRVEVSNVFSSGFDPEFILL